MYKNGFVVSVLYNGSPVKDIDRKVTLPFGSEYQLRIKNKSGSRAQFEVYLNGENINTLGRYIIDNGETVTLERFMGSSLSNGRKFKFVTLDDHRVSDPTSGQNGKVKIKFWKEKIQPVCIPYIYIDNTPRPTPNWKNKIGGTSDNTPNWSYHGTTTVGAFSTSLVGSSVDCSVNYCSTGPSFEEGSTVEGSHSNQSFTTVTGFETESQATMIEFKLVGPSSSYAVAPKPRITKKRKTLKRKFCPNCGESRGSSKHKFCPYCGKRL